MAMYGLCDDAWVAHREHAASMRVRLPPAAAPRAAGARGPVFVEVVGALHPLLLPPPRRERGRGDGGGEDEEGRPPHDTFPQTGLGECPRDATVREKCPHDVALVVRLPRRVRSGGQHVRRGLRGRRRRPRFGHRRQRGLRGRRRLPQKRPRICGARGVCGGVAG
eukprot:gene4764-biopygen13443